MSRYGYEPEPRKRIRRKEPPFQPTKYIRGPHSMAAHQAGGTLIHTPLPSREQFQRELDRYAPGCGSPIQIPGTQGGSARCGSVVNGERVFCAYCPVSEAQELVHRLLDGESPMGALQRFRKPIGSVGSRVRLKVSKPDVADKGQTGTIVGIDHGGPVNPDDEYDDRYFEVEFDHPVYSENSYPFTATELEF